MYQVIFKSKRIEQVLKVTSTFEQAESYILESSLKEYLVIKRS